MHGAALIPIWLIARDITAQPRATSTRHSTKPTVALYRTDFGTVDFGVSKSTPTCWRAQLFRMDAKNVILSDFCSELT